MVDQPAVRVTWNDGARWSTWDDSYRVLRAQLDALRDAVMGLDLVLDRWPLQGETLIDVFAPTEGDRAVFTAALLRAQDEAASADREALGLDTDEALGRYRRDLARLTELAQTDITW